jgi:hypothetical protein
VENCFTKPYIVVESSTYYDALRMIHSGERYFMQTRENNLQEVCSFKKNGNIILYEKTSSRIVRSIDQKDESTSWSFLLSKYGNPRFETKKGMMGFVDFSKQVSLIYDIVNDDTHTVPLQNQDGVYSVKFRDDVYTFENH